MSESGGLVTSSCKMQQQAERTKEQILLLVCV